MSTASEFDDTFPEIDVPGVVGAQHSGAGERSAAVRLQALVDLFDRRLDVRDGIGAVSTLLGEEILVELAAWYLSSEWSTGEVRPLWEKPTEDLHASGRLAGDRRAAPKVLDAWLLTPDGAHPTEAKWLNANDSRGRDFDFHELSRRKFRHKARQAWSFLHDRQLNRVDGNLDCAKVALPMQPPPDGSGRLRSPVFVLWRPASPHGGPHYWATVRTTSDGRQERRKVRVISGSLVVRKMLAEGHTSLRVSSPAVLRRLEWLDSLLVTPER